MWTVTGSASRFAGTVLITSPTLSTGRPGGATHYTPPCSFLSVPSSVGGSVTTSRFLSQFQPVANISSAWRVSNSTHLFQALYFTDPISPVDGAVLRPAEIVVVCVTDAVTGPP